MKSLLIFSALAAASSIAAAQNKTAEPDSSCTKYSNGRIECRVYKRFGDDSVWRRMSFRMDSVMANRAALGLEVRSTGNRRDTLGVFVEAVTEKGPAEAAGIVEGDRIASINGVDLRAASADADDDLASALGARRLSREVQKLKPGARVTLRVYSGARFRDVEVTAGKATDLMKMRTAIFRFPDRGFEYFGPDRMMIGPELPRMREELEPMMLENLQPMLERIDPMLQERLRDLPQRIEMRMAPRVRTLRMLPRTYRVDRGSDEERAAAQRGFIH